MKKLLDEIKTRSDALNNEPQRLFHGRGKTLTDFEHLVIDWYPPIALVSLYRPVTQSFMDDLKRQLTDLLGDQLTGIVVQDRSRNRERPYILAGTCPEALTISEDGLRYRVRPLSQQNVGFFPDMRAGRNYVQQISRDKKVLNLFAYTCGFSVAAIAGGAKHVTNVDMNRNLLDQGRENHRLNNHDLRQVSFVPHNLFKSFGRLKKAGPFDLVIIDPPYRQGSSFRAESDWPKIIQRLPGLLAPAGDVVAAVSAPELGRTFLRQQFTDHLPEAELVGETTAGANFPEADPDKGLHLLHYRL